jgi:flagellar basal-body rod protein FlgB
MIDRLINSEMMNLVQKSLDAAALQHKAISNNLANVDTPGFKPFDLAPPPDPGDPSALAVTDARHIPVAGGQAGDGSASDSRLFEDPGEAGPDGNAVVLERELAKIDANRIRYGATAELVTRRFALLKYAAGDGG